MKLKLTYKTKEEIPTGFEELYTEKDGEFVLTGVEGMKTDGDVTRVQQSLVNERKAHKDTRDKLNAITSAIGDLTPEQIVEKLDNVGELEAKVAALGKDANPEAVDRLVESKVKRLLAPIERERDQLKKQVGDLTGERDGLAAERKSTKIGNAVRAIAQEMKVSGPAIDDVLLRANSIFELDEAGRVVAREGVEGVAVGLDPKGWLTDMQDKAPHWWGASVGGGAMGNKGGGVPAEGNPFSAKHWNMTNQAKYVQAHGMDKAQQLAKQAGTTVGGPKPAAA